MVVSYFAYFLRGVNHKPHTQVANLISGSLLTNPCHSPFRTFTFNLGPQVNIERLRLVAGTRFELVSLGYEPNKEPLLQPAIFTRHIILQNGNRTHTFTVVE